MVGKEFYNIKNDSDENAWKFYEDFYSEKLDKSKKTLDIKGKKYDVSGDVCFNIRLKSNNKFTLLSSIIKDDLDTNQQEELNNLLNTFFIHQWI